MIWNAKLGRTLLVTFGLLFAAAFDVSSALGKLETWRQESSSSFLKGRREGVIVTDSGRVRLGQSLTPVEKIDAARIWDLARASDGTLYAATGDAGKVYQRAPKEGAEWTVLHDANDTQVLSLAILPNGHVIAGTGPSGLILDVTDPEHVVTYPRLAPDVKYIWDLAADSQGNLYAATGPTGQLWKVSQDGKRTLLLDSKHSHLLCLALAKDGAVFTGSDGEGLIYRVSAEGKGSVVYDAPQSEVRSLLVSPDGDLYAGTAAELGSGGSGGSGSGRGSSLFSTGGSSSGETKSSTPTTTPNAADPPPAPKVAPTAPATKPSSTSSSGGSATPKTASAGDNAVYRIGSDGVPREVFRARVLIYALAWHQGRLLIGTGPEGQLYEVRDADETAPIARLDHGQVLSMLAEPEGGLLLGTGDPGAVVRLNPGYVASGTLVSDVLDAKLISRFGALTWRSEQPEGTAIVVQVRTGNVGDPDETWSDWSAEQTNPQSAQAQSPPGRFAQYRVRLSTRDDAATPELRSLHLRYQTANLPPEITKIEVPDVGASDGATKQARLSLKWTVTDPNNDDLEHTLHIRRDTWPDWIRLTDDPLTSTSHDWDTTTVPSGLYQVRVTSSDRLSNNPDDSQTRDRVSDPFIVDHDPPAVTITPQTQGARVALKDQLTRIVKAAYSVDGGRWVPIFPDDTLFDTPEETLTLTLPDLKPGRHLIVLRATDAAGNLGTGDALIDVR